jgi:hypothetical protein
MSEGIENHQQVPYGVTMPAEEGNYYVLTLPVELSRLTHITFAICTRCGVPVYSEPVHDDFHRSLIV